MKVIFCTDGIFPHTVGGMQRHSKLLIEELARSTDLELTVVHPHDLQVFDSGLNIKEIYIKGIDRTKNYLWECYKYSRRVYEKIENLEKDIIYTQGLSIWYKIKSIQNQLVINPHGLEPYQAEDFKDKMIGIPFRFVFNFLFSGSSRVISLGGKLTPILKGNILKKNKVVVLANAVNLPDIKINRSYKDKEQLNLFFISRFVSNKGIHILIQAIKELNEEGYENKLKFNLAGKGPLHKHFTENHKYSNINYLGFVSDEELEEQYKINDLFVFPTLFEGMPTVVLEAMSNSLPIIVTDTGATSELVDNTNGYLIAKKDVQGLKKAIVDFYNLSVDDKESLSEHSFEKVQKHFTWKKVAERHFKLFQALRP